jgi:hypothetical protein
VLYMLPPSRWHLCFSCPALFPFSLAFHFWSLALTVMLSADLNSRKWFVAVRVSTQDQVSDRDPWIRWTESERKRR